MLDIQSCTSNSHQLFKINSLKTDIFHTFLRIVDFNTFQMHKIFIKSPKNIYFSIHCRSVKVLTSMMIHVRNSSPNRIVILLIQNFCRIRQLHSALSRCQDIQVVVTLYYDTIRVGIYSIPPSTGLFQRIVFYDCVERILKDKYFRVCHANFVSANSRFIFFR